MLCIYYLVQFQEKPIEALIDSVSEVNAMSLIFAKKLDP